MQVIGADPVGSVYSGGDGRPYLVEGVGEDFWPTTYDPTRGRPGHRRSDADSLRDDPAAGPGRRGCWSAARPAWRWSRPAGRPSRPGRTTWSWCCCPTAGRGYLSKIFDDRWMADYGFLDTETPRSRSATCCAARPGGLDRRPTGPRAPRRDGRHGHRDPARVRRVAAARSAAEPPVKAAEVVGSVDEHDLLRRLVSGRARLDDRWRRTCRRRCRWSASGEPRRQLSPPSSARRAVVWSTASRRGVLTRQDVLGFLADSAR